MPHSAELRLCLFPPPFLTCEHAHRPLSTRYSALFALLILAVPALAEVKPLQTDFFPVSVWYSGGKARGADALGHHAAVARGVAQDLQQIKAPGFNTVRTWVEWAHCEPREGEFHFENLKLLCELAQQTRAAGDRPDLCRLRARLGRAAASGCAVRGPERREGAVAGRARLLQRPARGARRLLTRFYTEAASVADAVPQPARLGPLERAAHHQLGRSSTTCPNAQFCFCPHTRATFREWLRRSTATWPA